MNLVAAPVDDRTGAAPLSAPPELKRLLQSPARPACPDATHHGHSPGGMGSAWIPKPGSKNRVRDFACPLFCPRSNCAWDVPMFATETSRVCMEWFHVFMGCFRLHTTSFRFGSEHSMANAKMQNGNTPNKTRSIPCRQGTFMFPTETWQIRSCVAVDKKWDDPAAHGMMPFGTASGCELQEKFPC